ncbi:GNAT family N-acetyltransferase [Bacillus suaedae]|uniref:GNAT family N-acetyltransferase n=1 Tax=Halalkalibacter suaedae TaxID=2822140 RepID=A0A940WV71_9BACI|nr:GNAT family N-acetyltransferase [Bacillus suaedae]MBP3950898.1 GNAT family N-acetyltransferase [Bacillus suaedae]
MNKTLLLNRFLEMEREYVRLFSEVTEGEGAISYADAKLPEMYCHNFTLYHSEQGLVDWICNELSKAKTKTRGFLQVETPYFISNELIDCLPFKPQITRFDLMYIETKRFGERKGNPATIIRSAEDRSVLEDGIKVDIAANEQGMGLDFAKRRIGRKTDIYNDVNKQMNLFVCYLNEKPIGNIEYMTSKGIVKLEDFDILNEYQRQGYGTAVLQYLLRKAFHENIELAYLVADSEDTAKDMYKKNGFIKIGEKTQLLFLL